MRLILVSLAALYLASATPGYFEPRIAPTQLERQPPVDPLISTLLSFQKACKQEVEQNAEETGYPAVTNRPKLNDLPSNSPLYDNLESLNCGVSLRMVMCHDGIVLKQGLSSKLEYSEDGEWGVVLLSRLNNGDAMLLVSSIRPNQTTLVRIDANLKCTLVYDSFRRNSTLDPYETTMEYIGRATSIGDDSFVLAEEQNATADEVTDYPRKYLVLISGADTQMQILDESMSQPLPNRMPGLQRK
jgi:hypothetical protein